MRKLLIRSCLIAGLAWTSSCTSNKDCLLYTSDAADD